MKKYKLLKDVLTFEKGSVFETRDGDIYVGNRMLKIAYTEDEILRYLESMKGWFEEIKPEYKRWRAGEEDDYYYISNSGDVNIDVEYCSTIDSYRYNTGNYFKTKAEAKAYRKYIIAKQKIKDSANGFKPNWSDFKQKKWCVFFNNKTEEYRVNWSEIHNDIGMIYFKTEEDAENSVENLRNEWDTVRKYESEN